MINKIGIEGRFRTEIIEPDGSVSFDSGENKNLILDAFLGYSSPMPAIGTSIYLCIGAGVVTAPAVSDTDLGNQIKAVQFNIGGNVSGTTSGYLTTENLIMKAGKSVDFTGFSGQDVSELGIRVGGSTGTLITRSMLKDSNGNPIAITVSSGQTLRITYYLYYAIPRTVIASGTIITPHGNLNWEYKLPSSINVSDASKIFLNSGYDYGYYFYYVFGSSSTVTYTVDVANRKNIFSITLSAQTSDRTVLAGNKLTNNDGPAAYMPHIYVTSDYTLPANYNFSMELEVGWGRLP